jgi:Arc/MetJ-type ribon-helix-helix transcriptional regulator
MRLTNEELDAIDEIRDLGSFGTRAEVLRLLFRPSLKQFVTAIQTKSVVRAGIVKIEEEVAWNKKVRECMKAKDLQVEMFPELVEA